jgi:hypothetical protein
MGGGEREGESILLDIFTQNKQLDIFTNGRFVVPSQFLDQELLTKPNSR